MSDLVFIRGLRLMGRIGVLESEKAADQPYVLDIEIDADLTKAAVSDALGDTVDYAAVAALATELMAAADCELIETYADRLAKRILAEMPLALGVGIEVRKPEAPMPGLFECAGVKIWRSRDD